MLTSAERRNGLLGTSFFIAWKAYVSNNWKSDDLNAVSVLLYVHILNANETLGIKGKMEMIENACLPAYLNNTENNSTPKKQQQQYSHLPSVKLPMYK